MKDPTGEENAPSGGGRLSGSQRAAGRRSAAPGGAGGGGLLSSPWKTSLSPGLCVPTWGKEAPGCFLLEVPHLLSNTSLALPCKTQGVLAGFQEEDMLMSKIKKGCCGGGRRLRPRWRLEGFRQQQAARAPISSGDRIPDGIVLEGGGSSGSLVSVGSGRRLPASSVTAATSGASAWWLCLSL